MVSKGVIQEYITDINFAVLGYRIYYIFTKHEEKSTKDSNNKRTMIIEHLNRLGNIIAEIEVLGGVSIFRVAIRETNDGITQKDNNNNNGNTISSLSTDTIEKVVIANNTSVDVKQQTFPTPTYLKIIRCLVLNPQIGVADISQLVSVSTRTANRILNKL